MLFEFHKPSLGDVYDPASPGWVGPDERDPADEDGVRLTVGNRVWSQPYADIPGNSWNDNRLNKFRERLNQALVSRVPLADLPDGDPDKTTDPADPPRLYWDQGDLCTQTNEITSLTFDPVSESLQFKQRKLVHAPG